MKFKTMVGPTILPIFQTAEWLYKDSTSHSVLQHETRTCDFVYHENAIEFNGVKTVFWEKKPGTYEVEIEDYGMLVYGGQETTDIAPGR